MEEGTGDGGVITDQVVQPNPITKRLLKSSLRTDQMFSPNYLRMWDIARYPGMKKKKCKMEKIDKKRNEEEKSSEKNGMKNEKDGIEEPRPFKSPSENYVGLVHLFD